MFTIEAFSRSLIRPVNAIFALISRTGAMCEVNARGVRNQD